MSETTETALANLDQTYYASVLTFLHNQIVSLADRRMLRTVEDELHIPIKYQSLQYVKVNRNPRFSQSELPMVPSFGCPGRSGPADSASGHHHRHRS